MRIFSSLLILLFALMVSCTNNNSQEVLEEASKAKEETAHPLPEITSLPLVAGIEEAVNASAFHQKDAVSFDIELFFGGKERLNGTILSTTNSSQIKLTLKNGVELIYDGKEVYQLPASETYKSARFDMFTWQYFFLAPFKLSDQGTNWQELEPMPYDGKMDNTAKLTFDREIGDAPKDWYIAYQDQSTQLLDALAYIVTFGKSLEEAESEPHAISYHDYIDVDGVKFATSWKFWMWTPEKGFFDQLGKATISNIKFVENSSELFAVEGEPKMISL